MVDIRSQSITTDIWAHIPHDTTFCIPAYNKSAADVSSQEATAYFTSPSATNRLPAKCFLRSPKRWKSLDAISRSVVHSLSDAGPVKISDGSLGPSDCHFCEPLKKHMAGKRFAADDKEKRSATSSLLTLTPIYSKSEYVEALVSRRDVTWMSVVHYVRGVLVWTICNSCAMHLSKWE